MIYIKESSQNQKLSEYYYHIISMQLHISFQQLHISVWLKTSAIWMVPKPYIF